MINLAEIKQKINKISDLSKKLVRRLKFLKLSQQILVLNLKY